ncbi:MAG TPA: EAL domain-containing protein [Thermomicrobiales bacterium]|nr:EAL domain-containing protein [Thermomicrobiales bacterium]
MTNPDDVLERISDALYLLNSNWCFTYLNDRACAMLRHSREELLGRNVWHAFPDAIDTVFDIEYHRALETGNPVTFEVNYPRLGGWFEIRVYPSREGLTVFFQEINERVERESALRESEARYRRLIDHLPAVTYSRTTDSATREVHVSPQIEAMTGYPVEEWHATSQLWVSSIHPDDRALVAAELERSDATSEPFRAEYRLVRKDGRVIWVRNEAVLIADQDPMPPAWQGFMLDITERKQLEEQLLHAAFHDFLTGLPNRAHFLDRTNHALARANRMETAIAVLFLDLDNFKDINDSYGHALGDELLTRVAQVLRLRVREGELLTRLGGDEFAVLLEDTGDIDSATRVAERLLEALHEPLLLSGRKVFVSASAGIVTSAPRHATPGDLLRDADIALYRAKDAGKRQFAIFEEAMHADVTDRLELESDLRRALVNDEFVLEYQPKVSLTTRAIVGVEALIRWEHPTRGRISPATFIPIAEQSGLILPIGRWILREACTQAAGWSHVYDGDGPFVVSVNLSGRQFGDPHLVEHVSSILHATGLDPAYLGLEITESAVMDDVELACSRLQELKRLGVRLGVDDFGTGYSSLAYLKRFPIDVLKIDRSFVNGLESSAQDRAIVAATITLAHALGLRVIAEGIETEAQLTELRRLGCDAAQGFLFSRPVTPSTITSMIVQAHPLPIAATAGSSRTSSGRTPRRSIPRRRRPADHARRRRS